MKAIGLFAILAITAVLSVAEAKSIDPELLFDNPNIVSLEMSPDSEQIAAHILDGTESLGIFDYETSKFLGLINFNRKKMKLVGYGWVDNDTLHFNYKSTSNGHSKHAFVDLVFNGVKTEFDVRYVDQEGYIVDYLPASDGQLLFSAVSGRAREQRVYLLTVDQLIEQDFNRKNRFRRHLEDAFYYVWDDASESLIALSNTDEAIDIWLLRKRADDWQKVYAIKDSVEEFVPVAMLNSSIMAVLSNKITDKVSLVAFDIESGEFESILYQHKQYDLIDADVDAGTGGRESKIKSVTFYDHGKRSDRYFQSHDISENERLKKAFPGKDVAIVSQGTDVQKKVVFVSSSADPGAFYLYDGKSLEAKLISNRFLDLDISIFSESEVLISGTKEGSRIESILTKPRFQSNGVLLVMPHGGPVGVRDDMHFDPRVQYLVGRGYSVLQVNFRGSAGFGKAFVSSGRGQWGKAIERDISWVVDQVRSKSDFKNICSIGSSYGGYSALMLAIDNPGVYDCAVAMYGVFDLPLLFNSSNLRMDDDYLEAVEKVVGPLSEDMKERSPFRLADKVNVPVLLLAGKEDMVSGFEQSNRMKYALRRAGADMEFLAYNGVGHGHQLWIGERHQAALVNDFLMRKLGLPEQDFVDASIRAKEYLLLADTFRFGRLVDEDLSRAVAFYQMAADLGSARAVYDLAEYYRRPGDDNDLELSQHLYEQAATQGFGAASYRLAQLSEDGIFKKRSDAELLALYSQSDELGYEYAFLDVARLKCLGIDESGGHWDGSNCLELLAQKLPTVKLDKKQDADVLAAEILKRKRTILAEIASSPHLNAQSLMAVKEVLKDSFSVNLFDFSVELEDYGDVSTGFNRRGKSPYIASTLDSLDLNQHSKFGVKIRIEDLPEDISEDSKAAMVVKWSFPPQTDKYGNIYTHDQNVVFPSLKGGRIYYYQIQSDWERVPGIWKIEILAVDGTRLAAKEFVLGSFDGTASD